METKLQLLVVAASITLIFACGDIISNPSTDSGNNQGNKSVLLPEKIVIAWKFDENGENEFGAPKTQVSIVINGKEILLENELQESCAEIRQSEFKDRGIPEDALSAFSSWWAGAGTINYVKISGKKLIVYRTFIDEQMIDDKPGWDVFKEISANELYTVHGL